MRVWHLTPPNTAGASSCPPGSSFTTSQLSNFHQRVSLGSLTYRSYSSRTRFGSRENWNLNQQSMSWSVSADIMQMFPVFSPSNKRVNSASTSFSPAGPTISLSTVSPGSAFPRIAGSWPHPWIQMRQQLFTWLPTKKLAKSSIKLLCFEWSPPWHIIFAFYLAVYLAYVLTFYLAFYLSSILAFYLRFVLTFCPAFYPTFYGVYLIFSLARVRAQEPSTGALFQPRDPHLPGHHVKPLLPDKVG